MIFFFFSSRRRHTRYWRDWSSDVCSSDLNIEPIAYFQSPFKSKFGVPKQSGLVEDLEGKIVFEPAYRNADALRGDRKSVVWGKSVDLGGRRIIKKKNREMSTVHHLVTNNM